MVLTGNNTGCAETFFIQMFTALFADFSLQSQPVITIDCHSFPTARHKSCGQCLQMIGFLVSLEIAQEIGVILQKLERIGMIGSLSLGANGDTTLV